MTQTRSPLIVSLTARQRGPIRRGAGLVLALLGALLMNAGVWLATPAVKVSEVEPCN